MDVPSVARVRLEWYGKLLAPGLPGMLFTLMKTDANYAELSP